MPISPSPAVLRACDVLAVLTRQPTEAFSISELARRVGTPRATCDAVLLALAESGFVVRHDHDRRYGLGPTCIALGDAARSANSTLTAASGEAEQLARQASSCVAVATRDGNDTRVAEVFDFGPPFGIRTRTGQSIPFVPPFGAVFVAWEDEQGVNRWLTSPGLPLTKAELERYRLALAAVHRRGYSVTVATPRRPDLVEALERLVASPDADDARRQRDALVREMTNSEYLATDIDIENPMRVSQMSAPVFDREGKVAAAIMVLGPNYDMTSGEINTLGSQLLRAAERATHHAGGHTSVTHQSG